MNKRIKPWVNKKIIEYIGEEELTLTEFICQKVMSHSSPQNLLNDVAMVSIVREYSHLAELTSSIRFGAVGFELTTVNATRSFVVIHQ